MGTFLWPAEDGWPYPDSTFDIVDVESSEDDDLLNVRVPPPHLWDDLTPTERTVVEARFGLGGHPIRTMKQLHAELGLSRAELRSVFGSALSKLRAHLVA